MKRKLFKSYFTYDIINSDTMKGGIYHMKNNLIKTEIDVINNKISVMRIDGIDYISLTDLAKYTNPEDPSGVIRNWMSNKNSFEYYSLWEEINNRDFNSVESHRIKINEVGYNRFTMTPNRWKRDFNAIGIIPSSGNIVKELLPTQI